MQAKPAEVKPEVTEAASTDEGPGPWGDPSTHLERERIEAALPTLAPPRDRGTLSLIVSRGEGHVRSTPERVRLTRADGVPGDAWARSQRHKPDAQITVMRRDFGELVANGQDLTLFGDNLIVDLDVSFENLPTGTRLGLGEAVLEVTDEPHNGCRKYAQRFGLDALKVTADRRFREQRLRGVYVKVVEDGEVAVGDTLEVLERARP